MTAAELLADEDFLAACKVWERDGRAPFWFADWLEERGMDGQARVWLMATRSRPGHPIGLYPGYDHDPNPATAWGWFWWTDSDRVSASLPRRLRPEDGGAGPYGRVNFPTFSEAIIWLLDRWAAVHAPAG